MKVLIACEFSGIIRDAFTARGHDAWSCDLLPTERPGNHYQCDIRDLSLEGWDLMIAHPPCQYLAMSGARWFASREKEQCAALTFVEYLMDQDIPWAIENPISVISTRIRKPDQIIQPWMFGHPETKATCLWLRGVPRLTPTKIVSGRHARVRHESPGPDRWKNRSRTLQGIADAMAAQWGEPDALAGEPK
jgi:hypothetical protein